MEKAVGMTIAARTFELARGQAIVHYKSDGWKKVKM